MSTEKNLALVRRVVAEIWNGLDLELADTLFGAAYINHGGIIPDLVRGPESVRFAVVLQHTAFPRLQVWERSLAAEQNWVELRWVAGRGRASRDEVERGILCVAHGTTLILCANDRIAESWTTWDCTMHEDVTAAGAQRRSSTARYRLAG